MQNETACNTTVFLNSGYLAENNETRNKVVVKMSLDEEDELHNIKLNLINQTNNYHTFNLSPNFKLKNTYEMICWCRYVCFDESQAYLVILRS
jgi:sulfur relay (sulfurtransferase) DsrC/TusE family protein